MELLTDDVVTEKESYKKALELIKPLQGLPIDQALGVLDDAKRLITAVHVVNVPNERFDCFSKYAESSEE